MPAKPAQKSSAIVPDEQTLQDQIAEIIVKDYYKKAIIKNEQIKNLLVNVFTPLAVSQKKTDAEPMNANTLLARREVFEKLYEDAL